MFHFCPKVNRKVLSGKESNEFRSSKEEALPWRSWGRDALVELRIQVKRGIQTCQVAHRVMPIATSSGRQRAGFKL
ncbi:uncharacterized protein LOC144158971 [Haemaphysalis longicornis]